jgi:hypothetical protein
MGAEDLMSNGKSKLKAPLRRDRILQRQMAAFARISRVEDFWGDLELGIVGPHASMADIEALALQLTLI